VPTVFVGRERLAGCLLNHQAALLERAIAACFAPQDLPDSQPRGVLCRAPQLETAFVKNVSRDSSATAAANAARMRGLITSRGMVLEQVGGVAGKLHGSCIASADLEARNSHDVGLVLPSPASVVPQSVIGCYKDIAS